MHHHALPCTTTPSHAPPRPPMHHHTLPCTYHHTHFHTYPHITTNSHFHNPTPSLLLTSPHPHIAIHSPDVTVEFSQSSYIANEGDRFVLLEISKNGVSQQDVFVDVVLQDLTARGGLASLHVLLHIFVSSPFCLFLTFISLPSSLYPSPFSFMLIVSSVSSLPRWVRLWSIPLL